MGTLIRELIVKTGVMRSLAMALLCLGTFKVNSLVQSFLIEFDYSLSCLPFSCCFAASVWLTFNAMCGLSEVDRCGDINGRAIVRTWRNAVAWGIVLYGLLVVLGSRASVSRWLGVILFVASISGFCLLCSFAVGDEVRRFLRSRYWQVRILSAIAGVALCLVIVALAETVCVLLPGESRQQAHVRNDGSYATGGQFFSVDPDLGYALVPDGRGYSRLLVDDRIVWDVTYTTDRFGRRNTVSHVKKAASGVAVFFGCSFLFGEGSEDHQTIPSQFCKFATNLNAINYGVPGWGTQHMLALLQSGKLPARISGPVLLGIYLYLPEVHEARLVGDMDVMNSFGQGFPCFELGLSGQVVRNGSFTTARPMTRVFYNLMGGSHLRARLGLNFPRRSEEHYRLTAAVIGESASVFRELFPESRFMVVVYPDSEGENLTVRLCRAMGLEVLNLQGLFNPSEVAWHHSGDGHPTPAANVLVAQGIAQYLQSGSGTKNAQ